MAPPLAPLSPGAPSPIHPKCLFLESVIGDLIVPDTDVGIGDAAESSRVGAAQTPVLRRLMFNAPSHVQFSCHSSTLKVLSMTPYGQLDTY